jgi:glycosyltransferase involved in cell wall biosynthesis
VSAATVKIAHIITEGRLMGGAQLNTFSSLRYQRTLHEVELISGNGGPLVDACRSQGIPVTIVPMENRFLAPLSDARSLSALVSHLRRTRPHVVHTHSSKAGILGRIAARIVGTPVIVHTLHGPSFHGTQPRAVQRGLLLAEKACARITDRLISVSDVLARDFVTLGICAPSRIQTIISGIDFTRFRPVDPCTRQELRSQFGLQGDAPLVMSVAHLMRNKGHELFLEVASRLSSRYPAARFVIVGDGDLLESLVARVRALGLDGTVYFTGNRDDVPELLASADVFVQTSYREGVSRSLVEAMHTGLAVVATDVGGTCEVVVDGTTGYLVSPGDADAIADRLDRLFSDAALRHALGHAAHNAVASTRSVEVMVHALDDLYMSLLAESGVRV